MNTQISLPADSPLIACMGRTASLEGGALRLAFPGIKIAFNYSGPAPVLHFDAKAADVCFNLSFEGWEPVVLHLLPGVNRIPLPTGIGTQDGSAIELTRRSECWQGMVDFLGLELPEGCLMRPPSSWPERKLLFIGDSITCGEGIDYFPAAAPAGPRWANAGRSYGHLLGRWLKAQVHLVSYGGRGLIRTWENRTDEANAPQFFERSLPDEPSALWDHKRYTPDAIIICLGTNDFNPGLIEQSVFSAAFIRFIEQLRVAHPQAAFVLAESPIFPDAPEAPDLNKRLRLRACLEDVLAHYESSPVRVRLASVSHQPGTYLDAHPVAFQHERIALEIMPVIKTLCAW